MADGKLKVELLSEIWRQVEQISGTKLYPVKSLVK